MFGRAKYSALANDWMRDLQPVALNFERPAIGGSLHRIVGARAREGTDCPRLVLPTACRWKHTYHATRSNKQLGDASQ